MLSQLLVLTGHRHRRSRPSGTGRAVGHAPDRYSREMRTIVVVTATVALVWRAPLTARWRTYRTGGTSPSVPDRPCQQRIKCGDRAPDARCPGQFTSPTIPHFPTHRVSKYS